MLIDSDAVEPGALIAALAMEQHDQGVRHARGR